MDELHLMNFEKAFWRAQQRKIILLWKRILSVYPDSTYSIPSRKKTTCVGISCIFLCWVQHQSSWISFQLEQNTEAFLYLYPSLRNLGHPMFWCFRTSERAQHWRIPPTIQCIAKKSLWMRKTWRWGTFKITCPISGKMVSVGMIKASFLRAKRDRNCGLLSM